VPEITVLMPIYNAEAYLQEAMDSILTQTFRDFEFLIIDDGSTDGSAGIVKQSNDPRIRFYQNGQNIGISATLNKGITLASCELIARMDADDISYPDRLKKQYDFMKDHPACGLLSTWTRVITHDKKVVMQEKHRHSYYYYNLNFECWIYHPTVMYRKKVVTEAGMYSMPYSEDYDLFWKISRIAKIDNLDEVLLDYRISPTSLNTVLRKKEYEEANRANVLRNLRFFMGNDFEIREEFVECLRHNFGPIIELKKLNSIVECLNQLDQINEQILSAPNINLHAVETKAAAWHKKDFIVEQISAQLSNLQKVRLSLMVRKPEVLFRKIKKSLRWRFNSIKQHFRGLNKH
jgi:glycosyltransferase involved in cell wall biosynthesis